MEYKKKHSKKNRIKEATYIKDIHPDLIPVIIESKTFDLTKNKFLVREGMTTGNLMYYIRNKQRISPSDAMFMYHDNTMMGPSLMLRDLYRTGKDEDGFLYLRVEKENTFG